MNIFKIIGSVIIVIVISIVAIIIYLNSTRGIHITINNNTDKDINELFFSYQNITEHIEVPVISKNNSKTINIRPKEEFSENVLVMYYYDYNRNLQQEITVGYFEKGYKINVELNINSMDENGVLDIEVQSKMLY